MSNSKVVYDGWMVRYGRRKIGRSSMHMLYFVLKSRLLAYYKRKPQENVVPIKTLVIDGNCRVEDRGLKLNMDIWCMFYQFTTRRRNTIGLRWRLSTSRRHSFGKKKSTINNQAFSRKHWRLLQCQNGLRIFEELLEVDFLPKSCSRAMKAAGVVEARCEEIFELVMSMDGTRSEWDCSFQDGSLVEEVDGHTTILYHRLQLDWFPTGCQATHMGSGERRCWPRWFWVR